MGNTGLNSLRRFRVLANIFSMAYKLIMKITEFYYQNASSVKKVHSALRLFYGQINRPATVRWYPTFFCPKCTSLTCNIYGFNKTMPHSTMDLSRGKFGEHFMPRSRPVDKFIILLLLGLLLNDKILREFSYLLSYRVFTPNFKNWFCVHTASFPISGIKFMTLMTWNDNKYY